MVNERMIDCRGVEEWICTKCNEKYDERSIAKYCCGE